MQASLINLERLKNLMLLLHEPLLELLDPFSELRVLMVKVVVLSRGPIELEAKLFKELLITLLLPEQACKFLGRKIFFLFNGLVRWWVLFVIIVYLYFFSLDI